ncbi:MAG: glycosyltransferase [Candidatus Micrarchaeia archaeon]
MDLHGLLERKEKYTNRYEPKTLVIIPAKGTDIGQYKNFMSIINQDYSNFDVVVTVDGKDDDAAKTARKAGISVQVAEGKCNKCSGKSRAILYTLRKFRNYDAYVIADSDIYAKKSWLKELVAPLANNKIGISTTFPYFVPANNNIYSSIKMIWGFVGTSLMKSKTTRFGWGGSLAFRRDLVDSRLMHLLSSSQYSVSDDISITKRAREKRMEIAYVDEAAPIVYTKETRSSFFEWANRQTALTLLGYRSNLYFGIVYYSAEIALFISGVVLAFFNPLFLLLLLHFSISEAKAFLKAPKKTPKIFFIVAAMPFLYLYNLLKASHMQSIEWRGRRYKL